MRHALITGITGQDGLFLAEQLAARDYKVFGLVRGQNNPKIPVVRRLVPSVTLLQGDLGDLGSLVRALEAATPDEIYNLAAFSYVGLSWQQPELTGEITGIGALRMLEAIRLYTHGRMDRVRMYQASSSEVFGQAREFPQTENTPFYPRSPYGAAKAFAHHVTVNYRESYGAWACCGIAFNHESERRGSEFVTRKVTKAAARIALGLQRQLKLGNLDSRRDWGFAGDYTDAMWRMLQRDEPGDYVLATGETHTVEEFVAISFAEVGIPDWEEFVLVDPALARPAEVDCLVGDASKAKAALEWTPITMFGDLVGRMCKADLALASQDREDWLARR